MNNLIEYVMDGEGNVDLEKGAALLEQYPDLLTMQDEYGITIMHWLVDRGDCDAVELMLEKGADVLVKDFNGCTPLHHATLKNNRSIIELLVRWGADTNNPDNFGNTPLHYAVLNCTPRIVEFMLNNGADPAQENNEGLSSYASAKCAGNYEILSEISKFL